MGLVEDSLREISLPAIFGGEEVNADFQKILGHSVKHVGLGIPDPWLSSESEYNTPNADSWELVGSLLGGTNLNYVVHNT